MDELAAFVPGRDGAWDLAAASNLLRRAGFAPSMNESRAALDAGLAKTVAALVDDGTEESDRFKELDSLGDAVARRENIDGLRGWWLMRMLHTRRPLWARMSIFWHNHFATSNVKVNKPAAMAGQLRSIENLGMGSFESLLLAMARDPAMIIWLDGESNIKGRPNENFARELFELFGLGVGHYNEKDIKEAARAFTGWHQRQGEFKFFPHDHDTSEKTVFGQTGKFDGAEIVSLTVAHPACSRFIAGKLLREFLCPAPTTELIEAFATVLREKKMVIADGMRTLLLSRAMNGTEFRRTRIKSPAEFAFGIVRSLEIKTPSGVLADAMSQMGQRLLEPPSVKGWDGHRAWLNTSTMLVRLNAAQRVAKGGENGADVAALRRRYNLTDRGATIEFCRKITLDDDVPATVLGQLIEVAADADQSMREALHILMSAPEYQMT